MTIDLERARADTPGCAEVLHFNNAGAALQPRPVVDAVVEQIRAEATIGGYEAAERAAAALDGFYDSAARLVGGSRDEIAWVENGTRAWDMAFYGIDWRPGDKVVTNRSEYGSNFVAYLQTARRAGIEVLVAPDDAHGQIDVAALDDLIDERVRLIAICHIPTNGGLVNPAAAVGRVARAHDVPYLLDAIQSAGQVPLDVDEIGCTMLAATGRKYLRGPRATGFLWVAKDWIDRLEPPILDNHAALWTGRDAYEIAPTAQRFETWEMYNAGRIGLSRAIDYALDLGLEAIRDRVFGLGATLREALATVPGVTVRDLGAEKCGIVTYTVDGQAPDAVSARLRQTFAINTSVTTKSFTLLDMEERGLEAMARASAHYYNTEDEIDRFVEAMKKIVA